MNRRDLFKGIIGTAIALVARPLAGLTKVVRTPYSAPRAWTEESLGLGCLDVVKAAERLDLRVGNPDVFYEGMEVEIYHPGHGEYFLRGKCRVNQIKGGTIVMDHVPVGTVPGDLLLLPRPHEYHTITSSTGEFLNLKRSPYPGKLVTPRGDMSRKTADKVRRETEARIAKILST